jgi:hypothetical protein
MRGAESVSLRTSAGRTVLGLTREIPAPNSTKSPRNARKFLRIEGSTIRFKARIAKHDTATLFGQLRAFAESRPGVLFYFFAAKYFFMGAK